MKISPELAPQPPVVESTFVKVGSTALAADQAAASRQPYEHRESTQTDNILGLDIEGISVSPERADAFARLFYDKYARIIHPGTIPMHPGSQEDIIQITLMKALQNLDKWPEDIDAMGSWLFIVARNTAVSMWRKEEKRLLVTDMSQRPELFDATIPNFDNTFSLEQLLHGVGDELNEKDRHFIDYVYGQGMNLKEYAKLSDIPYGTAKSRGSIVRRKLKELHDDGKL